MNSIKGVCKKLLSSNRNKARTDLSDRYNTLDVARNRQRDPQTVIEDLFGREKKLDDYLEDIVKIKEEQDNRVA